MGGGGGGGVTYMNGCFPYVSYVSSKLGLFLTVPLLSTPMGVDYVIIGFDMEI